MMRMAPVGCRDDAMEPVFNLPDRAPGRKAQPVGDPKNMRIHGDCLLIECGVQDDVGRFAADPGERFEGFAVGGHHAAMPLNQARAGLQDMGGLGVVQANRGDMAFEPVWPECAHAPGIRGHGKQGLGGGIDTAVGCLRRQHDRNQQLKRRAVDEFRLRLRVGRLEPCEHLFACRRPKTDPAASRRGDSGRLRAAPGVAPFRVAQGAPSA